MNQRHFRAGIAWIALAGAIHVNTHAPALCALVIVNQLVVQDCFSAVVNEYATADGRRIVVGDDVVGEGGKASHTKDHDATTPAIAQSSSYFIVQDKVLGVVALADVCLNGVAVNNRRATQDSYACTTTRGIVSDDVIEYGYG